MPCTLTFRLHKKKSSGPPDHTDTHQYRRYVHAAKLTAAASHSVWRLSNIRFGREKLCHVPDRYARINSASIELCRSLAHEKRPDPRSKSFNRRKSGRPDNYALPEEASPTTLSPTTTLAHSGDAADPSEPQGNIVHALNKNTYRQAKLRNQPIGSDTQSLVKIVCQSKTGRGVINHESRHPF